MATVDELLAEEATSQYSDVNDVIFIDPVTRRLIMPPTEVILGVETDKDAERKYFQCPKNVGADVDLDTCSISVNYENAGGERNSWLVDDLVCHNDMIIFSWKITEDVARYMGTVSFNVCFCKYVNDVLVSEWNTTTATGTVLEGLQAS